MRSYTTRTTKARPTWGFPLLGANEPEGVLKRDALFVLIATVALADNGCRLLPSGRGLPFRRGFSTVDPAP
jgi:hypothetical protein